MKIKFFAITLVATFAAILSACGGGATNTANNTAANKPANTTNTTTNTNSANNTTNSANNSTSNSASNTAATTEKTDGETVNLDAAGVKITVPKTFKHEKDGDAVLVTTPDDGVFIVFSVPAAGDFETAVKESAKTLDTYMKDVKVEAADQKTTINGMEAIGSNGTGVDKESGKTVKWTLAGVKTDKKPVLVILYGEEASLEKHKKDGEALMGSLKKQ